MDSGKARGREIVLDKDIAIKDGANFLKIGVADLPSNCVVVISAGKAKIRGLSEYGEYSIVTHDGKVKMMENKDREWF